ncbi:PREDICTED: ATPase family AAA domain-containing protein 5 isoform X2 [Bactrocera latifrons]|uniref:ATPase family AAA domain-containing protein 5 n=3 Tax=Bactrocera latifrons TaxID=174628 RepID=A0A0K8VE83_BACLA|nr:PREDICTED: ATPase family AAA domain-containing protein 5 isoform X2 [Bactrocera latifrons]XP_018803809.1 PREDICTED: ATPase family AAA domain-containing protein 5 isoform X2 [Bactrocera latifrons]
MEEVLNSVKKKHRQKHRRKREQKKLAQMEAAAVAVATAELDKVAEDEQKVINKSKGKSASKHVKEQGKRSKTKPLQEKTAQENGQGGSPDCAQRKKSQDNKSPLKNASINGDILRHFQRTPKKNQQTTDHLGNKSDAKLVPSEASTALIQQKAMNAFEVMMNARNKAIGSNTPGKETSPTISQESAVNTKRKLILQEWADKKGGIKRKLDEEARAAYVDQQLENRAKRFKQMLVNGASPKKDNSFTSQTASHKMKSKRGDSMGAATKQYKDKAKCRKRTILRPDSTDSVDERIENAKTDSETEEFLSKLNSPTKKRDSLLGYFPRKESPKDLAAKTSKEVLGKDKRNSKTETPKSRNRRCTKNSTEIMVVSTTPVIESSVEAVQPNQGELEIENTPSSRPKRSCAGRARYDYDLEKSPTKISSAKKCVSASRKCETAIDVEIINLDDSNMSTPEKSKKLAPLFVRSLPKPSPDPVALKAKHDFLMSGVPEKMRIEIEKQKQYEQNYEEVLDYFPRICHVQQLNADEALFLQNKIQFTIKLKLYENDLELSTIVETEIMKKSNTCKRRSRNNSGSTKQFIINKTQPPPFEALLPTLENKRSIIKLWKSQFDRFPTFKCYNQMREKYRYFSALDAAQDMEQVSESFVVTRRTQRIRSLEPTGATSDQDEVKPPPSAPNGELLFTEKYKPMLVEQVLVNLVPVTQLRDFLSTWANGSGGSARNSQSIDDSFDVSNDSNSSLSNVTGNAVVLLGPVSSGKTNAVYALANDMNFNVLEINAGMKRTGKRLIQELQEATQSHQIRKDSTPTQSSSKAQKNLLRMSLNGKKLMKQNSQSHIDADSNAGCSGDVNQNSRKCLILIEDADVVFDQLDSGFTDAIYTLAACSKRPVIVMATNPNCQHLQRLMNQNTIYFTPPNALNISRFMAVLSLIENCPINLDDLLSLYLYNRKDLRRTLLELQFFIQSGGDRTNMVLAPTGDVKTPSHHHTPQKEEAAKRDLGFFASPTKRSLSVEDSTQQQQEPDEQLSKDRLNKQGCSKENDVYIHRSMFEFFTVNQNEKWRIPFPVDFSLLRVNLTDIFQCSKRLLLQEGNSIEKAFKLSDNDEDKNSVIKRRTRTPKKTALNSSLTNAEVCQQHKTTSSLEVMCDFYESISIGALLGMHNADMSDDNRGVGRGLITGRSADLSVDRLQPHLSEEIAHEIVEQAIKVNLAAKPCPYNLFDTPRERLSLCDYMNSTAVSSRSQRTRALDVEPALRAICRSEKQRATHERRSTRFYHYLRHSAINVSNFSTTPFDNACTILVDAAPEDVEAQL